MRLAGLSRRARIALAVLGLALASLAIVEWMGWPFLRGPLERELSTKLRREVTLGDGFRIRFVGHIRIASDELSIGNAPDAPAARDADASRPGFIRAHGVELVLPWRTVIDVMHPPVSRPLRVISLEAGRAELALVRDASGRANWSLARPGEPRADASSARLPDFDRLVVREGEVWLDDAKTRLDLDARLSSTPEGATTVQARGHYRHSPIEGVLRSDGFLPIAVAEGSMLTVPLNLQLKVGRTDVQFDGRASDVIHLAALDGELRLSGPSLAAVGDAVGVTLPTTSPFRLQGHFARKGSVWSAEVQRLVLGSSRLRGSFSFDTDPEVASLTAQLRGERLALPDLAPALGAAVDESAHHKADARLLPDREFDLPSLSEMDADVDVRLDELDLGTPRLDALRPVQARITLRRGLLSIADLHARASSGDVRGVLTLDARTREAPQWRADVRWAGVRLEQFVKARNPRDHASPNAPGSSAPAYASGVLAGEARLRGVGKSTASMLGSLQGSLQAWLIDARLSHLIVELAGIDVAESLGLLASGDSTLPVRCALANFVVTDGVATPKVAVIDTDDTTLGVEGNVSFKDESLALRISARPKDATPVALRSPLLVRGHFTHPEVGIEKKDVGVRLAAAAALSVAALPAALLAFVDLGDGEKAVCQEALQRMNEVPPPSKAPRTRVK
jgi:uncharacterized protein involved in outer membrane biogenesis